jgi:hypothetical protein
LSWNRMSQLEFHVHVNVCLTNVRRVGFNCIEPGSALSLRGCNANRVLSTARIILLNNGRKIRHVDFQGGNDIKRRSCLNTRCFHMVSFNHYQGAWRNF